MHHLWTTTVRQQMGHLLLSKDPLPLYTTLHHTSQEGSRTTQDPKLHLL
jgi:hypothetical protein